MMFWYGDHPSTGGWVLMTLGMVVFWGLLIFGFVLLTRSFDTAAPQQSAQPATPEQVLAERFAHGDIDEPEYTARLTALRGLVHS